MVVQRDPGDEYWWLLVLLYMRERALPSGRGGVVCYALERVIEDLHAHWEQQSRPLLGNLIFSSEEGGILSVFLDEILGKLCSHDPPYVQQSKKARRRGFLLTDAGRRRAEGLVADLDNVCVEVVKQACVSERQEFRVRSRKNRERQKSIKKKLGLS